MKPDPTLKKPMDWSEFYMYVFPELSPHTWLYILR